MGNYLTAAEAAQMLRLDGSNTDITTELDTMIDIAEEMVNNFCRTSFAYTGAVDVTRIVSGNGKDAIWLNEYISSLTSVYTVNHLGTVGTEILYCAIGPRETYTRKGAGTMIISKVGSLFPEGTQNLQITGKFGFATTPKPIKYATALITKQLMDATDHNFLHKEEEFFGKNTVNNPTVAIDSIPRLAQQLLGPYRINSNFDNALS